MFGFYLSIHHSIAKYSSRNSLFDTYLFLYYTDRQMEVKIGNRNAHSSSRLNFGQIFAVFAPNLMEEYLRLSVSFLFVASERGNVKWSLC